MVFLLDDKSQNSKIHIFICEYENFLKLDVKNLLPFGCDCRRNASPAWLIQKLVMLTESYFKFWSIDKMQHCATRRVWRQNVIFSFKFFDGSHLSSNHTTTKQGRRKVWKCDEHNLPPPLSVQMDFTRTFEANAKCKNINHVWSQFYKILVVLKYHRSLTLTSLRA